MPQARSDLPGDDVPNFQSSCESRAPDRPHRHADRCAVDAKLQCRAFFCAASGADRSAGRASSGKDGGPAADAGLRRGDSILTFGAVGGGGDLAALAAEARMGVGRALGVRVLRREAFGEASLMLTVTPRESPAWRGLLGVQILPPPPS